MSEVNFNPYLNFGGNAREAMEFYQSVFGGELTFTTFSDIPGMPAPEGYEDKIMHSLLQADDVVLMGAEGEPGRDVTVGDNINLSLSGDDDEKLTAYFTALSEGGQVAEPLDEKPWGDKFGMVIDRYGINWLFNIGKQ